MTRRLPLALALLALAWSACTFERRPPSGDDAPPGDTAAAVAGEDPTGLGMAAPESVAEARSFFRRLQELRGDGRAAEVRTRIHADAAIVLGSRALSPDAPDAALRPLLAPGPIAGEATVELAEPLDGGVLLVVR